MQPNARQLPARFAQLLLTPVDGQMCPGRARWPQPTSPCSHSRTATQRLCLRLGDSSLSWLAGPTRTPGPYCSAASAAAKHPSQGGGSSKQCRAACCSVPSRGSPPSKCHACTWLGSPFHGDKQAPLDWRRRELYSVERVDRASPSPSAEPGVGRCSLLARQLLPALLGPAQTCCPHLFTKGQAALCCICTG